MSVSISGRARPPLEHEAELIAQAQRGSLDSFNLLVLHYQNSVFTLAYRILGDSEAAADAVQSALIAAYRRLSSFRGGSFRGWLLRITANQCYDELRRRKRQPATSLEDLPDAERDDGAQLPDPADSPEQTVERREVERAVQDCIQALGPDQRVILVLSDVEGLDYQTIAETLNLALGTVKSRLSRARASVRDCLQAVAELLPAAFRLTHDRS
ncbi:MAG: RNA polymerase sigma factor [Candidatus Flexifilum sp.]